MATTMATSERMMWCRWKRGYVAKQRNTVTLNGEWLANTTMQKALADNAPGAPT